MTWLRSVEKLSDGTERTVWTNDPFNITKAKGDKYRLWYGMALVGLFDKLQQAKKRIEDHLDEFFEEDE